MKSERSRALRVLIAALALVAMLAVAACGETKDDESTASSDNSNSSSQSSGGADPNAPLKEGLKTVSIPKQLGNPYEEFEHSGVDEALKELKGSNRITGPTDASASSQISIINAAVQQKPDAIIIAGNDPNAIAPALKQADQRDVKVVAMDSDVAPDARAVFVNQVTTQLVGENQVESIGKQIDYSGEIAILSATANATNQNAWIKVMKETLKKPKYKDMKLVKVAYGDDDELSEAAFSSLVSPQAASVNAASSASAASSARRACGRTDIMDPPQGMDLSGAAGPRRRDGRGSDPARSRRAASR